MVLSFELYSNHDSPQDSTGINGDWDYIPVAVYNWDTLYNDGEDIEAFAERRVKLLTKVQAFVRMWVNRRFATNIRMRYLCLSNRVLADHPFVADYVNEPWFGMARGITRLQAIFRGRLARGWFGIEQWFEVRSNDENGWNVGGDTFGTEYEARAYFNNEVESGDYNTVELLCVFKDKDKDDETIDNWDTLYNDGEDIEAQLWFGKLLTKVQAFVRMWASRRRAANVRKAKALMCLSKGALSDHPRFQEILGTTDNQVYWKLTRFQAIVRGRLARGGYVDEGDSHDDEDKDDLGDCPRCGETLKDNAMYKWSYGHCDHCNRTMCVQCGEFTDDDQERRTCADCL